MIDFNLLIIPIVALGRALLGWIENAFIDGRIDLPEWRQLGATVIRMGTPMAALVFGLQVQPEIAAGIVVLADIIVMKIYNSIKK